MGRTNDTTLGLSLTDPCNLVFVHFRRTAELSLPASLLHIIQCYAANTIIWVLNLWKGHPDLQALNGAWVVVTLCTIATILVLLWAAFRHAAHEIHRDDSTMSRCFSYISGAFVIGLAIRLAGSIGGCEASSPANLNTTAIILTILAMRLAGLQAQLVEPGMGSFRDMFLTADFLAPVVIVVFMNCAQFTDFGRAADIWMFQMLPEFVLALLLDWAHIKTAVGFGGLDQGAGHVRRRRRGGGEEANVPNPNAEVDVEWEYVH